MSKARQQRESVRHLTYFVVQAFSFEKGSKTKISADTPIEARDRPHALRLFERYKPIRAGVVAFHRTGDPKTGEWQDAVILARHGVVSAEVDCMIEEADLDFENGEFTRSELRVA